MRLPAIRLPAVRETTVYGSMPAHLEFVLLRLGGSSCAYTSEGDLQLVEGQLFHACCVTLHGQQWSSLQKGITAAAADGVADHTCGGGRLVGLEGRLRGDGCTESPLDQHASDLRHTRAQSQHVGFETSHTHTSCLRKCTGSQSVQSAGGFGSTTKYCSMETGPAVVQEMGVLVLALVLASVTASMLLM